MTQPTPGLEHGLTIFEVEVLEMLAGEREGVWGAWVSACLESLSGFGFCTRGPNYQITPAGIEALSRANGEQP